MMAKFADLVPRRNCQPGSLLPFAPRHCDAANAVIACDRDGGEMGEANGSENGVTFALEGEDHTLANALRFMLNKK